MAKSSAKTQEPANGPATRRPVSGTKTLYSGPRRNQADRTAETRAALIAGAVKVIHRVGYGAASTALIADEAGTSRGSIIHHFGTRAALMAEVVRSVYEEEQTQYTRLISSLDHPVDHPDWVEFCWSVLSQPPSMAVLEILQASRSDPELAEQVAPMQSKIEQRALVTVTGGEQTKSTAALDEMRLIVWAIRGLSLAQVFVPKPAEIRRTVSLFKRVVDVAASAGVFSSPSPENQP